MAAINRKSRAIAMFSGVSTAASCKLLHECRTRPSAAAEVPHGSVKNGKNDCAANMLIDALPSLSV
jgi:uncharacterized membrane protein